MSCRELLDLKIRYFENRSDAALLRSWIADGRAALRRFMTKYPFLDQPERIEQLTPSDIWNPGAPCDSFLGWLMCQLRPLGGLNEKLSDRFPNAARNDAQFKTLLQTTLAHSSIGSSLEAWQNLRGFGGGKQVAKKIVSTYFPSEYLPIANTDHMRGFATYLGLSVEERPTDVESWLYLNRQLLLAKEHHESTKASDNIDFMYILYFSPPAPLRGNLREPWKPNRPVWCVGAGAASLADIVKEGESSVLEFKPCLLRDAEGTRGRRDLRKEAAKTIAGFLNTNGGQLLIGVSDSGDIVGIVEDLAILRPDKRSNDQFELAIRDIVRDYISPAPDPSLIKVAFDDSLGPTVCVVAVGRSGQPVYVVDNNEQFYVRAGNRTELRQTPDAVSYIQHRFPREASYP